MVINASANSSGEPPAANSSRSAAQIANGHASSTTSKKSASRNSANLPSANHVGGSSSKQANALLTMTANGLSSGGNDLVGGSGLMMQMV